MVPRKQPMGCCCCSLQVACVTLSLFEMVAALICAVAAVLSLVFGIQAHARTEFVAMASRPLSWALMSAGVSWGIISIFTLCAAMHNNRGLLLPAIIFRPCFIALLTVRAVFLAMETKYGPINYGLGIAVTALTICLILLELYVEYLNIRLYNYIRWLRKRQLELDNYALNERTVVAYHET